MQIHVCEHIQKQLRLNYAAELPSETDVYVRHTSPPQEPPPIPIKGFSHVIFVDTSLAGPE